MQGALDSYIDAIVPHEDYKQSSQETKPAASNDKQQEEESKPEEVPKPEPKPVEAKPVE